MTDKEIIAESKAILAERVAFNTKMLSDRAEIVRLSKEVSTLSALAYAKKTIAKTFKIKEDLDKRQSNIVDILMEKLNG